MVVVGKLQGEIVVSVASSREDQGAKTQRDRDMRKDIQALRAVAVGAVVLGHLWPGSLPGGRAGVDVFFVISGFLITAHLLRRPPVDRKTLFAFWARRIRRLLPAATLVLGVTILGVWAFMPAAMTHRVAIEAAAASVYSENWARWQAMLNPAAAALGETPIQHYWSLSIEEQFYVVWPLLIGALVLLGRRFGQVNRTLMAGIAGVVGVSFLLSVWTTATNGALGYFGTHVRIWELAIGGFAGLAFHAGWRMNTMSPALRIAAAWLGFVMIMASAFKFGSFAYPFPGPWALLPVLGTALVIAAETDGLKLGFGEIFGWRPIQYIGDMSYSVYLWHWPIIMLMPFILKHDPNFAMRLAMGVLTLGLGSLTREFVEEKLRYQKGIVRTVPRSYVMGALCILVVLGLALVAGVTNPA